MFYKVVQYTFGKKQILFKWRYELSNLQDKVVWKSISHWFCPSGVCGGSCTWTRVTTSLWRQHTDQTSLESSLSAFSPRQETLWGKMGDTPQSGSERKKKNQNN